MKIDTWAIGEDCFDPAELPLGESLYSQGNGFLGTRGTFEEGGGTVEGVYVNGFYETADIHYEEAAYGFARKSQTMLNVPNGKIIKAYINGELFSLPQVQLLDYERRLDFKRGLLTRRVLWQTSAGKEVLVEITRMLSFENPSLMCIRFELTPMEDCGIRLVSAIDADVTNVEKSKDPRMGANLTGRAFALEKLEIEQDMAWLLLTTKRTRLSLCSAMKNIINIKCRKKVGAENDMLTEEFQAEAKKGQKITLTKYIAYCTGAESEKNALVTKAKDILQQVSENTFEALVAGQEKYLNHFWDCSDIVVEGDKRISQGIRFNLFHLLQSAGRNGKSSISAKGLSGEGYEGHYFWEAETYIMPVFLYSMPELAKALLTYRYHTLDSARDIAKEMGHPGAMYPWRTINGCECSAFFLAGTAQYHITGDIAWAIKRYYEATEDRLFMLDYGAEILFETARMWANAGHFNQRRGGRFCIDGVTGPDEYTALVNNNCYTNVMAAENMLFACEIERWMKEKHRSRYALLKDKIKLDEKEVDLWKKAGENIYLPYDEELKIFKQDDSFLDKKAWDFKGVPIENYPLLLHYHPLVIYRHQVSKQPDLLLIEFLVRHRFNNEQTRRDYNYYSKVITHDSSLSESIFSIIASIAGDYKKAYRYFLNTVRMDIDDTHNNTTDGLHTANMAGVWASIVDGFAGMLVKNGELHFNPYIPDGWKSYSFKLRFKGRLIRIQVTPEGAEYKLLEGKCMEIWENGLKKICETEDMREAENHFSHTITGINPDSKEPDDYEFYYIQGGI